MKLNGIKIENFGKLTNFSMDFSEGLNTINEENGWGKSTLAAFIRVMLFGFEGETKRNDLEKERKRYKPWQGGTYGGSLILETGGRRYRIVRLFGTRDKDDEFKLYDEDTGMPSNDYSDRIGEELFGLDSGSFNRTVMINQNDMETEATDGINAKLGNISDVTDDIDSYDAVAGKIKDRINRISHTRATGMLYQIRNSITELESDIRNKENVENSIKQKTEAIDNLREQLNRNKVEEEELYSELEKIRKQEIDAAAYRLSPEEIVVLAKYSSKFDHDETKEISGLIDEVAEARSKLSALISKEALADSIKPQPIAEKRVMNKWIIPVFVGLLFGIAGAAVIFAAHFDIGVILFCIGAALTIAGFVMKVIEDNKRSEKPDTSEYDRLCEEIDREKREVRAIQNKADEYLGKFDIGFSYETALSDLSDIKNDCRMFFAAKEKKRMFGQKHDLIEGDSAVISDRIKLVNRDTERLYEDINDMNHQLSQLMEELDELSAKEDKLKEEKERYRLLSRQETILIKTRDLLEKAKTGFVAKYNKPVAEGFRKYYRLLEGTDGDEYSFDANMNLRVEDHGDFRKPGFYSAGSMDKIELCFRMGLIDAMFRDEKPMIVMDDPFVNFDDKRLAGGKKMIEVLAGDHQILYMTCHQSRKPDQ